MGEALNISLRIFPSIPHEIPQKCSVLCNVLYKPPIGLG